MSDKAKVKNQIALTKVGKDGFCGIPVEIRKQIGMQSGQVWILKLIESKDGKFLVQFRELTE